ncbi:MAG: hypothetical protein IT383_09995 [Deltaproteobacteria bacterium]|nr:hypothetical protein [Deltaproteobacteria bacterium]
MIRVTLAVLSMLMVVPACDLPGACVGTGGVVDECKEDWTQSECTDWDDQEVNGASWSFHAASSCDDLGYSVECADGSFVAQSGDC